ncbi:Glycoside Hydrolase Family 63 protein [Gigaspora rosea]|uniref:Mannosyl-oligosaccharide glucosidase n=1 Tax=Gigaspora rosea TaxID=44941 RepID=A0A397U097_9GLOM|nr:Glycoside Hydrolase Family 63 protein [Gigaspora rosea]
MHRLFIAFFLLFSLVVSDIDHNSELQQIIQNRISANRASNESLLWGTYRPNLYFGTRPRLPESLMSGLMWFGVNDLESFQKIRHECDQSDKLEEYSYKKHDGRDFALQTITDAENNVILTTEFLKVSGGGHGGDWAVRISGKPISEDKPSGLSILYYLGLEGDGSIDLESRLDQSGLDNPVELSGETPDLGQFAIKIVDGPDNRIPRSAALKMQTHPDLRKTQYLGHLIPDGDIWRAKFYLRGFYSQKLEYMREQLASGNIPAPPFLFALSNQVHENSNFYIFQKLVEAPFQFDIFFESSSSPIHIEDFTSSLQSSLKDFDMKFENTFGLASKGFDDGQVHFAQTMLSNLIGGIGYFYGSSIVDKSYTDVDENEEFFWDNRRQADPKLTPPSALFSATPSRPFFPRGFYWDEGFHQLIIGNWDNDLSLDIIKHWTSLIDNDGWVAREQILGEEARSKVPPEFQTQYPHYANPPTLLMAIEAFIERLDNATNSQQFNIDDVALNFAPSDILTTTTDPSILPTRHLQDLNLANSFLAEIYPKLRSNYKWYRRTQWGEIKEWGRRASNSREAYRWRGRTPGHTLTSGLDDYPRPTPPHPAELHVDLMCWVGFMARSLRDIAERLNEEDDVEDFSKHYKDIINNLHDLHWSEKDQAFCDVSVDDDNESVFVCHKGYLSLFPMLHGFLPNDSPKLGAILDLIYNPDELWSPYGLRSLSKSDKYFNTEENYWRGPVWININYFVLSSLHKNYAAKPGPYQEKAKKIYKELRNNIINNVYNEFKRTGYSWEQYSAINGEGIRSHPFNGWTSLVILIMAEKY